MSEKKPVTLAFTCCKPKNDNKSVLPPIILFHGCTSSKERWRPIQQDLANKSHRVVYAVDARNHGESEWADFFSFDILTEDLKHFMNTHGISKASLIGHSMGGLVTMALALTSPDKVEKLIVEDVSPKDPEPELYYVFSAMIEEQIKCFEQQHTNETEGSIQQKLRETLYRNIPMIPDDDQEVIKKMEFPIKKTMNGFESQTNLRSLLKAVQNPPICNLPKEGLFSGDTLFIYGGKSYFAIGEEKDVVMKFFPKAGFCCFDSAGHEVCSSNPKQFVEEVCKFL